MAAASPYAPATSPTVDASSTGPLMVLHVQRQERAHEALPKEHQEVGQEHTLGQWRPQRPR